MPGGAELRIKLLFCALLAGAPLSAATAERPVVAVIDSGVARTAELNDVLVAEYDFASNERPQFAPRYDHGTMVATIIHREGKGAIDIISMRIDDPAGCPKGASPPCQPDAEPIADAIRYAASLGVDAINLSLSLDSSPMIVAAVREAAEAGVLVVLAAGNEGRDTPGNLAMARAGFPGTVLVGAVDAKGKPWSGTNRPHAVQRGYAYVWRLGVNVPTIAANGGTVLGTGTSFAAPIETARRLIAREAEFADATGGSVAGGGAR